MADVRTDFLSKEEKREPAYARLKQDLIIQIEKNVLQPKKPILSEHQLSMKYKICRTSVRRALSELVNEGLLIKIPGKGTIVRTPPTEEELSVKQKILGVLVNQDFERSEYLSPIFKGLNEGIRDLNCHLIFEIHNPLERNRQSYIFAHAGDNVDGLITIPVGTENPSDFLRFQDKRLPFVVLGREAKEMDANFVTVDHCHGAFQAVEYLFTLGHRRIAFINGPLTMPPCRDRLRGYKQVYEKHGMEIEEEIAVEVPVLDFDHIYQSMFAILNQPKPPTAVFIGAGGLIWACCKAIKEKRLRIPEDISVIAYDDITEASNYIPPLSVARQPLYEMGKMGVQGLLAILNSRESREPFRIVLKPELILRQSCSFPGEG